MDMPEEQWHANGVLASRVYRRDGKIHRDGDQPAVERWHENGVLFCREYRKDGKLHRDGDNPAEELWCENGMLCWRTYAKNDGLHRDGDQPAHERWRENGMLCARVYGKDGEWHRDGGQPAVEMWDINGVISYRVHSVNGSAHRRIEREILDVDKSKSTCKVIQHPPPYEMLNALTEQCTICCDVNTDCRIRRCHHCFHATCIDAWLLMQRTCPLCRSGVDSIE